jgi:hypothetical protein
MPELNEVQDGLNQHRLKRSCSLSYIGYDGAKPVEWRIPFAMKQKPNVERTRQVLWLANLTTVMILGGVIKFLPDLIEISGQPALQTPVLVLALLSIPLAFFAGRLLAVDTSRQAPGAANPAQAQKAISSFAIAGTLAELPAMLGLVYAVMGGDTLIALLFAAASLAAMFVLRPPPQ